MLPFLRPLNPPCRVHWPDAFRAAPAGAMPVWSCLAWSAVSGGKIRTT